MSQPTQDLPTNDRAWTWQGERDPAALRLEERALPAPGVGEVLVRNEAIGLNPVDWKALGGPSIRSGHVPGVDGAGVVAAVGEGVPAEWLGRRVAYHGDLRRHGSFAEYTLLPRRVLMRLPDALAFEAAAAFPCPGLTAWRALDKLPVRPGASCSSAAPADRWATTSSSRRPRAA